MARRIFLHVGPPKTGTTYLQSVVWSNRMALEKQGLLLPLDHVRDHFVLAKVARAGLENTAARGRATWERMAAQVCDWPEDVLISHELFAATRHDRVPWVLDQLGRLGDELHPIITARDLARQIPAKWQQSVRQGHTDRLRDYYKAVKDGSPTTEFWNTEDLPQQIRVWGQTGVTPDHLHLVTVPPAGADLGILWTRFADVIGIDPNSVDISAAQPNESLGVVESELLRRVNGLAPTGPKKVVKQNMVRLVLVQGVLTKRPTAQKFGVPADEHGWVVERATAMVDELRTMAFDLHGDLDDLQVADEPAPGPIPDDVSETDIAAVAVEVVSSTLYRSHEYEVAGLRAKLERLRATTKRQRVLLGTRRKRTARQLEDRVGKASASKRRGRRLPAWVLYIARRLARRPYA